MCVCIAELMHLRQIEVSWKRKMSVAKYKSVYYQRDYTFLSPSLYAYIYINFYKCKTDKCIFITHLLYMEISLNI